MYVLLKVWSHSSRTAWLWYVHITLYNTNNPQSQRRERDYRGGTNWICQRRKHIHIVKSKFDSLPSFLPSEGCVPHKVSTLLPALLNYPNRGGRGLEWWIEHSACSPNTSKNLSIWLHTGQFNICEITLWQISKNKQ